MADLTYEHELEATIMDLMHNSVDWNDIQADTGLSEERCREIEAISKKVRQKYSARNRLPTAA